MRLIPFPALLSTYCQSVCADDRASGLFLFLGCGFGGGVTTWVLFPALSIVFTLGTVLMANHYLGLRESAAVAARLLILTSTGLQLRWNRYELVFAARDKHSVTELKDALWAPLESDGLAELSQMAYPVCLPAGRGPVDAAAGCNPKQVRRGTNECTSHKYARLKRSVNGARSRTGFFRLTRAAGCRRSLTGARSRKPGPICRTFARNYQRINPFRAMCAWFRVRRRQRRLRLTTRPKRGVDQRIPVTKKRRDG